MYSLRFNCGCICKIRSKLYIYKIDEELLTGYRDDPGLRWFYHEFFSFTVVDENFYDRWSVIIQIAIYDSLNNGHKLNWKVLDLEKYDIYIRCVFLCVCRYSLYKHYLYLPWSSILNEINRSWRWI